MLKLTDEVFGRAKVVAAAVIVALGSFAPAVVGSARAQGAGGERVVTMKDAAPSLTIAVPLAMAVNRTDKPHGIAVDLQASGTSSSLIVAAVLSGQVEFGSPGTADALQAIRQGAKLKIIAAIVNNLEVVVIRNDVMEKLGVSPTAPVADRVRALKGLTIGTGAVGSTLYQVLRAYLIQYGLDPDKDVRLVGLGEPTALVSGLEQKRFDAIAYASPIVEFALAKKVASIWVSAPRGDVPGTDNVKMCVIIARAETVENKREDVDALRAALADALRLVRDDHAATGPGIREKYFPNLDPAVWAQAWDAASKAYPADLAFPREAFDFWIKNDSKGADSYGNVDYTQVVYAPAQVH